MSWVGLLLGVLAVVGLVTIRQHGTVTPEIRRQSTAETSKKFTSKVQEQRIYTPESKPLTLALIHPRAGVVAIAGQDKTT